jgi:hypothetical protein
VARLDNKQLQDHAMRYILIIYFFILVFNSNGQKIVCLNQDFNDETNDSIISFIKGNLIATNAIDDIKVKRTLREKAKFVLTDCTSKQEYLFIDSLDNPKGWLIIDKSRNRVGYIDQEIIFIFNTLGRKCIIDKRKNCGFDVFTWSKTVCGFSEPCYEFKNGNISIEENKRCRKNIKLVIDMEYGMIKKPKIKKPSH